MSLADPTGAISDLWWLIPSALTWSYQNTMASIFGFWLTLDFTPGMILWFLPNLLTLFLWDDLRDNNRFGGFRDVEGLSAKNYGAFAFRSGGVLDMVQPRTWTYQFLVSESGKVFTALQFARAFQADAEFTPALYGTVLHCVPSSGKPFLLRGQRTGPNGATLTTWGRSGGRARASYPGSSEPVFPEGALHFSEVVKDVVCPQKATISELTPQVPVLGTATSNRAQGTWPGDARSAADGQLVALIGTAVEIVSIVTVVPGAGTTVANFDSPAASLLGQTVRLRGLPKPPPAPPTENVRAQGARNLSLVQGATQGYAVDDVLRISLAGAVVQRATVARFEAALNIDEALPGTFASNIQVFLATASGGFQGNVTAADTFTVGTGTVPSKDDGVVVRNVPAIVTAADPATKVVTVNRNIGANGNVTWRNLTRAATPTGTRDTAAEGTPIVTYTPVAPRTAPNGGFVWCESGGDRAARTVVSRAFDGMVIGADLPDPAALYSVELFKPLAAPDVTDAVITTTIVTELSAPVAAQTRAIQVMEFTGAGITAGAAPLLTATAKTNRNLTGTIQVNTLPNIVVSDVVVLGAGSVLDAAVVGELRAEITFMTNVPGRDTDLDAVLLAGRCPAYAGEIADPVGLPRVRVLPQLNGDRVDLPRYAVNDLVRVSWGAAAPIDPARERFYRITPSRRIDVRSDGDAPIDPRPARFWSRSCSPADPETGSSRLGRAGRACRDAAAPNRIDFAVWQTAHFTHNADRRDHRRHADRPPCDVQPRRGNGRPQRHARADRRYRAQRADRRLTAEPRGRVPAVALHDGVPRRRGQQGGVHRSDGVHGRRHGVPGGALRRACRDDSGHAEGGIGPCTDDTQNASIQNTRREAVVDHELAHTLQSARLGPWLFTWCPNWLMKLIGESTSGQRPEARVLERRSRGNTTRTRPRSTSRLSARSRSTRIRRSRSRRTGARRGSPSATGRTRGSVSIVKTSARCRRAASGREPSVSGSSSRARAATSTRTS